MDANPLLFHSGGAEHSTAASLLQNIPRKSSGKRRDKKRSSFNFRQITPFFSFRTSLSAHSPSECNFKQDIDMAGKRMEKCTWTARRGNKEKSLRESGLEGDRRRLIFSACQAQKLPLNSAVVSLFPTPTPNFQILKLERACLSGGEHFHTAHFI